MSHNQPALFIGSEDDVLLDADWFEGDTASTLFALGFASPVAPPEQ